MFATHDLPVFILSGLLLNITPGADTLYVITCAANKGWRAGVAAAFGISLGCYVHIFAAALGLSALLATSSSAFVGIKLLGAAYLLYLGLGMLFRHSKISKQLPADTPLSLKKIVLQGFLTDALNPKMALFFLAFVPQFIEAGANDKFLAFLFLGVIFNINATLWCLILAGFTAYFRHKTGPLPGKIWLSRLVGLVFILLGLKLGYSTNTIE
ncbi:LysE family translocator [Methylomonas sp. AM2-LC]|uniref:LysE family translocator n=1 Tax=Methylomonas sp. AM2-LC TaxID=3153301 RepID=UPI003263933B